MIPILQSVAQIKALFTNERWQILMDSCAVKMFLGAGAGALETHKYVSELLGKETIDIVNDGKSGQHSNTSYNKTGRDLMTPAEARRMDRKNCVILMEGEFPIFDRKALPWQMPEEEVPFREAMALNEEGGYENPVHVAEDRKTGEQFTIYEDRGPIREDTGDHPRRKRFDIDENVLVYQNQYEMRG